MAKSKQLFTNYRQISQLSNISKVLEKVIHKRMMELLMKHDILYNKQFGCRPGHSTTDAIHTLTCDALRGFDDNPSCLSGYLDLSKAFDTINHNIEAESPLCSFNHCLWSTVKCQTDMSTIWPCHGF